MGDRTFSPPPPLAVTIAGHGLAVRFVDTLAVDGRDLYGWADVNRGELLVCISDDALTHLPDMIGGAVVAAMFQLCPEYGVAPADVMERSDAEVWLDGAAFRSWAKGGIRGTLAEASAATWPAVRQEVDGSWSCPRCSARFAPADTEPWHRVSLSACDHLTMRHGVPRDRVRAMFYRPWRPRAEGGAA